MSKYKCQQCKKSMTVVEWIMNPVCLSCAKENHKKVMGK